MTGGIVSGDYATSLMPDMPAQAVVVATLWSVDTLDIELRWARAQASVMDLGLSEGVLGGAMSEQFVNAVLIPQLAASVSKAIATDCTPVGSQCWCALNSPGASFIDFFDDNNDCSISLSEFSGNSLIDSTLRNPDLDLLDATGNPGSDGVRDHLSFGVGFTAVRADF
jgi:hypothetical protein